MKLFKVLMTTLAWKLSMAISTTNLLTSEPLLQSGRVSYLHTKLSQMGPLQRAVLVQKLKNHDAGKLLQAFKLLLARDDSKADRKSERKSQNKRKNSRFNRFRKFHTK